MEADSVSALRPDESTDAVGLLHDAFTEMQLSTSIYYSRRSAQFLRRTVALGDAIRTTRHIAARRPNGELSGYCEVTLQPPVAVLSYIAVARSCRGRGIGRALLRSAVAVAAESDSHAMELDVFSDNDSARGWYHSLGFDETGADEWYLVEAPPRPTAAPITTIGIPQAELLATSWGFGHASIGSGRQNLVLLGEDLLRVRCKPGEVDQVVETTGRIFSGRRLLISPLGGRAEGARSRMTLALSSRRLRARPQELEARL